MTQERVDPRNGAEEAFNHPSIEVAPKIGERWYLAGEDPREARSGQVAFILIPSKAETLEYKILLVEAHSAMAPGKPWQGKRLEELRALPPSAIKAYGSRAGVIPFIVASGGDNIAIRSIENIATGEIAKNATAVAAILNLKHSEEGKLVKIDETHFAYRKLEKES